MKKKLISITLTLLVTFTLTSCKPFWVKEKETNKNQTTTETTDNSTTQNYVTKVEYTNPKYNLSRDHVFSIDISSSAASEIKDNLKEAFGVFADSNLTQKANPKIEYDSANNKISIAPPMFPILDSVDDSKNQLEQYKKAEAEGNDKYKGKEYTNWGNANNLYLAQFIDTKTGEKLEKPLVTVFTIKPELKTPTIEFYTKPDGTVGFKWDKIDGAEKYIVYRVYEDDDFGHSLLSTVAETTDTKVENFYRNTTEFEGNIINMNLSFNNADSSKEMYCVMAMSGNKKSLMSNLIKMKDHANKIPTGFYTENGDYKRKANGTLDLPATLPVKMGDGTVIDYPLIYKLDTLNHNNIEYEGKQTDALMIKVQIANTLLTWDLYALDIDTKTLDKDMKTIEERQNKLRGNALKDDINVNVPSTPPENVDSKPEGDKKDTSSIKTPTDKIFASTPMVEYIAKNMLNGEDKIVMSSFPEASDRELLLDSIFEAYYQNPLILGINGAAYDYNTDTLIIEYKQNKDELKRKQNEIIKEVDKVTKKIIKSGMSDLEKETAINDYLCESAEYDMAALENAKANNMVPDASFDDSFTAYGILVKKVGVCASYAASFKLLADSANLDCIVVTGVLSGSLPHAWNRVLVDGNWMTIDSTNNDNDYIKNALFNLPDSVSKKTLVEDNEYILDDRYGEYKGEDSSLEYYKINNKFFSKQEIASELAKELKANKQVTLRTDYDLSESDLKSIAQDTMKLAGITQIDEYACYLGVIYFKIN